MKLTDKNIEMLFSIVKHKGFCITKYKCEGCILIDMCIPNYDKNTLYNAALDLLIFRK